MTFQVQMRTLCLLVFSTATGSSIAAAGEPGGFPSFKEVVIDPHCGDVCYAVTTADVDGDGKLDIVAVTEREVLWYQAPDWKKRVIISDQTERDNVCIAAHDIDGDGKIDFALGAGWTKVGTIQWLSRGESLDEKWKVHKIGEEKWLHRMRFADVLGTGKPQLTISPLNKTVGEGVRLTAFEIPENPKTDRWKPTVMDHSLNRMHNHWHIPSVGIDAPASTFTASQEGLHQIFRRQGRWLKVRFSPGMSDNDPAQSGCGEVKVGRLPNGRQFITTIEPMHGTSVAVYASPEDKDEKTVRNVIEDSLVRGHALWTADVDGDGADEIIVGHSNTKAGENLPRGLYVFDCVDKAGKKWQKHTLDDGGIAVEDAVAADLTGDGRVDVVAGGRYTHNVKLYVNGGGEN